jgi:hypothetical protein
VAAKARELEGHDEVAAFLQIGLRRVTGKGVGEDFLDAPAAAAARRAFAAGFVCAERKDVLDQFGMEVCSSNATTPPWPTPAPMAASSSKPSGVSIKMRRNHADDRGPPMMTPFNLPAAAQPPPISSMMCRR